MEGTPEYQRHLSIVGRSREKRQELRREVNKLTYHYLADSNDFSLIKSFHDEGTPQVVTLDGELFRYDL